MVYDRSDNITSYVSETGTIKGGVESRSSYEEKKRSYSQVNALATELEAQSKVIDVYSQDVRGNRTEDKFGKYEWNDANQLVKIVYKNNKLITQSEMGYDALGKPLWIRDGYVSGMRSSRLIWCGLSVCQKRDGTTNSLQKSYARQGEWIGSTKSYYLRDYLGSVVATTANGSTLNVKIERDAYGKEEAIYGSKADAKYAPDVGYAGMYYHWSSGFNLTPNRWYDSRTGRWLSRDPIAENGGTNLYAYVGNNPLNYTDPSGLWSACASFYWGVGGSCCVGSTDEGKFGIGINVGVGIGGGINVSTGSPVSVDLPSNSNGDFHVGVGGGVSGNLGPISAGISHNEGVTFSSYPNSSLGVSHGIGGGSNVSATNSLGIGAGVYGGVNFGITWGRKK